MALSNAERQARLRERKQQKLSECVTPADIDRAVQILYEGVRQEQGDLSLPLWDDWVSSLGKKQPSKSGREWGEFVPDRDDPEEYPDCIPLEDRQFLAKVGAVIRAARWPASHR
ncbi:hypothetical protein [Sphingobium chungbukense]|uniref:Uncharacterized protein n=1 Tax=Sphingobium chungbukense TaxID=56193 RepID=A0A0M3ASV9_9SPHN|nr:hypothetical protein [Sphingobium chungbukense]KKW92940.1 hypothetical protein YP76_08630 [Sphingobium chungbukense]